MSTMRAINFCFAAPAPPLACSPAGPPCGCARVCVRALCQDAKGCHSAAAIAQWADPAVGGADGLARLFALAKGTVKVKAQNIKSWLQVSGRVVIAVFH